MTRIALGLLLSLPSPAAVQAEGGVRVEVRVYPETIAVGETAELVVTIGAPTQEVEAPELGTLKGLSVSDARRTQTVSIAQGKPFAMTAYQYTLTANAPGKTSIGPVGVKAGGLSARSPAVTLTVAGPGKGAGPALSARASVEPTTLVLGKHARFAVTVTLPKGQEAEVEFPVLPAFGASFIGQTAKSLTRDGKPRGSTVFEYDLVARTAGKQTIGGVRVRAGGQIAWTEPVELEVVSAPPPAAAAPARAAPAPAAPETKEEEVDRLTDKIKTDEDRRKFLATRQYIERNKGKAPKDAAPFPIPDDVDIRFARTESERKFLLETALVGVMEGPQNAPRRPPSGPAALASVESLTAEERAKYDKLADDVERRKFLATREYLKRNAGKDPSATSPKPMPDDVDIRYAFGQEERRFMLAIGMDEM